VTKNSTDEGDSLCGSEIWGRRVVRKADDLTEEGELICGCPHNTPCGKEVLGDEIGSEIMTGVVMDPCGNGPNYQEQCVVGGRLLAFGCLGL
jgi:hypothetical protein